MHRSSLLAAALTLVPAPTFAALWTFAVLGTFAAALLATVAPSPAQAAGRYQDASESRLDPALVRIDETRHLGQALDPATGLVDGAGQRFALGELLGKPLVLVFSYYGCDGSCPTINENLAGALGDVGRFRAGRDFRVLTVSFDRKDTAGDASAFATRLHAHRPEAADGWRFAVLDDPADDAPRRFADRVGFRFWWSRIDKTFLHPNVLVFLTPQGRVARYLYGTGIDARNLELALIDADWGRISNSASAVFDMITGACFSYNFSEGRYQPNYALFAGLGALAFGLGSIGAGLYAYRRQLPRRVPDVS